MIPCVIKKYINFAHDVFTWECTSQVTTLWDKIDNNAQYYVRWKDHVHERKE